MVISSEQKLLPYFPETCPVIPRDGVVMWRSGNIHRQAFDHSGRAYSFRNYVGVDNTTAIYNPKKRIEIPGRSLLGLHIDIFA